MRIAILGAGAMGSWFGGHLAINGQNVQLLTTNRGHIDAVERDGLELRSGPSSTIVQLPICMPTELKTPVDLVITLTKTFQLQAALESIQSSLHADTAVLSLQNGLGNEELIAASVGVENTWIGMTMLPVDRIAPGIVECKGMGSSWFGHASMNRPDKAAKLESLFVDAGLDVRFDNQVKNRIWQKVAFNAGMNAVCALTHSTPGILNTLADAKQLVKDTAKEVVDVAAAMNITVDIEAVCQTVDYACENHGQHLPSMLQDLLAGKPTEIDALNGSVVRLARELGIPVPINTLLATLVKTAELGHSSSEG